MNEPMMRETQNKPNMRKTPHKPMMREALNEPMMRDTEEIKYMSKLYKPMMIMDGVFY